MSLKAVTCLAFPFIISNRLFHIPISLIEKLFCFFYEGLLRDIEFNESMRGGPSLSNNFNHESGTSYENI